MQLQPEAEPRQQHVVRAILYRPAERRLLASDLKSVLHAWRARGGSLWLDVAAPDYAVLEELAAALPVELTDLAKLLDRQHRAHVVEHASSFYLQLPVPSGLMGAGHGPHHGGRATDEQQWRVGLAHELGIFCGPNFLLTLHAEPELILEDVWERYAAGKMDPHTAWPDLPLYSLCEQVLRGFFPYLDWLEDEHAYCERLLFAATQTAALPLSHIFRLKRQLLSLRRVIAPLRDAMGSLSRRDFPYLSKGSTTYFADLYDRALRLLELEESMRDLFSGLVDASMTVQSNRMNEVMKTLTIIATIMMPLTLVTGFFGMNFDALPGIHSALFMWIVNAVMLALAGAMVWYFKRRHWW